LFKEPPAVSEFFLDRVRYYFREIKGFAYDEVNAVLASVGTISSMSRSASPPSAKCVPPKTSNP